MAIKFWIVHKGDNPWKGAPEVGEPRHPTRLCFQAVASSEEIFGGARNTGLVSASLQGRQ
jgi:hypothetical protein